MTRGIDPRRSIQSRDEPLLAGASRMVSPEGIDHGQPSA
jgi:hypothetical protein